MLRRTLFAVLPFVLAIACGGDTGGSPTSPTPVTRGALAVVNVEASGARRSDGGYEIAATLRLRETGGVAVTVASATIQFLDGGTAFGQVVFDQPLGGTNRIAAGQELSSRRLVTTAWADRPFPTQVRVTVAYTDDHQVTGSATGQGDVPGLPGLGTLVGIVRHAATSVALGGVRVTIQGGVFASRSSTTDGNGFFSIPGLQGPLTVSFALGGYATSTRDVMVNGDTRLDATLSPLGPVAPQVEYRVRGSRASLTYANDQEGTAQVSNATLPWSYAFSGARTGQFLYISAQNTGDSGVITVEIYKRGTLYRTTTSSGAFAIATASGSY